MNPNPIRHRPGDWWRLLAGIMAAAGFVLLLNEILKAIAERA
ncbi:MAG: hypothetical protein ABIH03_08850 [Pseudomonadota bacterium]